MNRCGEIFRKAIFQRTILVVLLLGVAIPAFAQELEDARKLFLTGKYDKCIRTCEGVPARQYRQEDWPLLHANALLAVGRYPEAELVVSNALSDSSRSIRLRVLGYDTANAVGDTALARMRIQEINALVAARAWAYREPKDVVALGRAALLLKVDPKIVLEKFFGPAQKMEPPLREAFLAGGQLALDKHDYALAAKMFDEGLKKFPDDADLLCGLAKAYEPSARARMSELVTKALEVNENHVPSMLLLVDHLVDAEGYFEADEMLTRALKVNPWQPEAWAYRAVLAHLDNNADAENAARDKALRFWKTNPTVDYLIGLKLSQKYRFAEGSSHQRQAIAFDPNFTTSKIQLAEDLLRLGNETEGWALADEVHRSDGYDVTAFNLVTLHGTMQKFSTVTNEHFVLRMGAHEAELYGDRALALLEQAREKLTAKYGVQLESPTYVEIFPEQKDFGVRTFGMPDNPGFLGVCFGRVVTATSPASQAGNPANWEAVLWHEFTHVITLQFTKNKMPRWLSEGISVYEELQENPGWGQRMNPRYREMALGKDLTPVGELSAAFLAPKSDLHLQFAYYESYLVVEFLVQRFGFEKLTGILSDLRNGTNINEAIARNTAPMPEIEKDFKAFAKARAVALGPDLDWNNPKSGRTDGDLFDKLKDAASAGKSALSGATGTPNYWNLVAEARKLIADKKWEEAKAPLNKLIELCPDQSGHDNAYAMLALAHRGLKETDQERAALEKWAASDVTALDAFSRLMELCESDGNWKGVAHYADCFLAVNPLLPQPYRFLGRADEELGETAKAVNAYQKTLLLDPIDPAEVHFRLARLLHRNNDPSARRHVLQALEDAPRFREAHRLLLELAQTTSARTNATVEIQP